jgi:hypothetical protein
VQVSQSILLFLGLCRVGFLRKPQQPKVGLMAAIDTLVGRFVVKIKLGK